MNKQATNKQLRGLNCTFIQAQLKKMELLIKISDWNLNW